jgi:6-phosphofructo-2-kinase
MEEKYPEEWQSRRENKLEYRYPGAGGESYMDVIERVRPIIIELERMQSDVLIVSHNVVC